MESEVSQRMAMASPCGVGGGGGCVGAREMGDGMGAMPSFDGSTPLLHGSGARYPAPTAPPPASPFFGLTPLVGAAATPRPGEGLPPLPPPPMTLAGDVGNVAAPEAGSCGHMVCAMEASPPEPVTVVVQGPTPCLVEAGPPMALSGAVFKTELDVPVAALQGAPVESLWAPVEGTEPAVAPGCAGHAHAAHGCAGDTATTAATAAAAAAAAAAASAAAAPGPGTGPPPEPAAAAVRCQWKDCQLVATSLTDVVEHIVDVHIGPAAKAPARQQASLMCGWPGCERVFRASDLVIHINSHLGHRPFKCEQCPQAFMHPSTLKSHIRSRHSDNKSFACPESDCDKKFAKSTTLRNHMLTHTNELPFPCPEPECDKKYRRREDLVVHQRRHRNERPFLCEEPDCDGAFVRARDLRHHRSRMHSNERPYECGDCDVGYAVPADFVRHKRMIHGAHGDGKVKKAKNQE